MKLPAAAVATLLALASVQALVSCQGPDASPKAATASALPPNARRVTSNGGTYMVVFAPAPDPMPVNEPIQIRAWVLQADHQIQLSPAKVTLAFDAAMPEHQHGMNTEPVVHAGEQDSFAVDGVLLHMPGRWQLYFDVTRDGITERAQCDVTLE